MTTEAARHDRHAAKAWVNGLLIATDSEIRPAFFLVEYMKLAYQLTPPRWLRHEIVREFMRRACEGHMRMLGTKLA